MLMRSAIVVQLLAAFVASFIADVIGETRSIEVFPVFALAIRLDNMKSI